MASFMLVFQSTVSIARPYQRISASEFSVVLLTLSIFKVNDAKVASSVHKRANHIVVSWCVDNNAAEVRSSGA